MVYTKEEEIEEVERIEQYLEMLEREKGFELDI